MSECQSDMLVITELHSAELYMSVLCVVVLKYKTVLTAAAVSLCVASYRQFSDGSRPTDSSQVLKGALLAAVRASSVP